MAQSVLLFALVFIPTITYGALPPIRSLGITDMGFAAFAQVLPNTVTGKEDLVVSTFNPVPFTKDEVYVAKDIAKQLARPEGGNLLELETVTDELPWPNEVEHVPADVLNRDDLWWCASGFLVPTKGDGNVALIEVKDFDINPAVHHDISTTTAPDRRLWWYHRVEFHDMNEDGRKDALSSRAYLDEAGEAVAQMVWFEHPSSGDPLTSLWQEHVLYSGPDALWRLGHLNAAGNMYDVIISTQYFQEKLVVSWIEPGGSWTIPSTIQHYVIDAVVEERYFDCQVVDLNGDGKDDLLVSINSDKNGKLVAYEIPDDWRNTPWTRHDIADGFKPQGNFVTEGNGAPGSSMAFHPTPDWGIKPMIILTGDDDGNVYLFENDNDADPGVWTYTYSSFFYAKGTVGGPAVTDLEGDGFMEVFVPEYTGGKVHTYTFKP